jgi:hypothetical protein
VDGQIAQFDRLAQLGLRVTRMIRSFASRIVEQVGFALSWALEGDLGVL